MVDVLAALLEKPSEKRHTLFEGPGVYGYGSSFWPFQSIQGDREKIGSDFQGYVNDAYKSNGVVFAVELVRHLVFSDARFAWRRLIEGRPGDLFYNRDLEVLRRPWENATTGDLLTRVIQDADLAGNFYGRRRDNQVKRLRPDWTTILLGLPEGHPDDGRIDPVHHPDADLLAYLYFPAGLQESDPIVYLPDEIVHFAPIPDPLASYRGMSWLTPVLRDVQSDKQATLHKSKFFENGATPNMIVSLSDKVNPDNFGRWVEMFNEAHEGVANAYKTLFLGGGADAEVVGSDFQQLDFKATQGAGETRIAVNGGIHPTVIGLSEGLQGSSLNAGNYSAARRSTADRTFRPLWRNVAGSFESIMRVPGDAELGMDLDDVAFLREDQLDAAEIQSKRAQTVRTLLDAGYEADSVILAVENDDFKLLKHTGLFSVQLQPPGSSEAVDVPAQSAASLLSAGWTRANGAKT